MYIIYYETKEGRHNSMPSKDFVELAQDLAWLESNGDTVVKVVQVGGADS